jgi:hypothetical protein
MHLSSPSLYKGNKPNLNSDSRISWKTDLLWIFVFLLASAVLTLIFLYGIRMDPFQDIVNVNEIASKNPRNITHPLSGLQQYAVIINSILLAPILLLAQSGIAITYVRRNLKLSFLNYIPLLIVGFFPLCFYLWHRYLLHQLGFFSNEPDAQTLWGFFKLIDPTIFVYLRCITLSIASTCLFEIYSFLKKISSGEKTDLFG